MSGAKARYAMQWGQGSGLEGGLSLAGLHIFKNLSANALPVLLNFFPYCEIFYDKEEFVAFLPSSHKQNGILSWSVRLPVEWLMFNGNYSIGYLLARGNCTKRELRSTVSLHSKGFQIFCCCSRTCIYCFSVFFSHVFFSLGMELTPLTKYLWQY